MTDLHRLDFREVLVEDAWPEYERSISQFYLGQLVPLNVNIYMVEKITEIPFDLFFSPEDYYFFRLSVENALQVSLLTITRVTTDKGRGSGEPHTLPTFKNWLLGKTQLEYKDVFWEDAPRVPIRQQNQRSVCTSCTPAQRQTSPHRPRLSRICGGSAQLR